MSLFKGVCCGMICSLISALLFSVILGAVMLIFDIPDGLLDIISAAVIALCAYIGGYSATQFCRSKGMIQGALCGSWIFAAALLLSILFGLFRFSDMTLIKAFGCLIFGTVGGIRGVNTKKTAQRH